MADVDLSTMVYVSPGYGRIWGVPPEALYRNPRSFLDTVHPDDRDRVIEDLKLQKLGRPFDHEYRIIRPDGDVRWIWDRGFPIVPESGPVTHYVGVAQDITARKHMEETLRRSLERFELAARATGEALWEVDLETKTSWWSDTLYEHYGYSRDTQPSTEAWLDHVHPDDRERVRRGYRCVLDGTCSNWREEYRYRRADGTYADVLDSGYAMVCAEGHRRLIGAIVDVTDRKRGEALLRQREQRFRAAFEQAAVGMLHVSEDGMVMRVNERFCATAGYGGEEVLQRSIANMIVPEDLPPVIEGRAQLLSGLASTCTRQVRLVRKDGSLVWVEATVSLVRETGEEPPYFLIVTKDITTERALQAQLLQSQRMEAIGQLAGGVAHDFNNLLTVIQGYAEALAVDERILPEHRESTREMVGAARRAAELTRKLLLVSRQQVMQPSRLELNEVVTGLERILTRVIREDIHVRFDLAPGPLSTYGDPAMIEQVLLNLTVNAKDALPAGGEITIATCRGSFGSEIARRHPDLTAGDYVGLSVSDTGTGIGPEVLPHIFEPFFSTKGPQGTGLGLATVFGIVRQHHGWIEVDSEGGRGTTFRVWLPKHEPADTRAQVTVPSSATGGNETILVVEDESAVRRVTCATLERHGYRVMEATTGDDALRVFEGSPDRIDLLLTDMVMPGTLSGRALGSLLQARDPDLKVLLTSGHSLEIAGKDIQLSPNEYFLEKPFSPRQLIRGVRTCLDRLPADA